MFRYVTILFCMLAGCQSSVQQPASPTMTTQHLTRAKPLSDAEMEKAMTAAERAQAMTPAVAASGMVGGLDPTGLSQKAVDIEAQRRMADLQQYMPGLAARNFQNLEQSCAGRPKQPEMADICRQFAELKAEMKAKGIAAPGSTAR